MDTKENCIFSGKPLYYRQYNGFYFRKSNSKEQVTHDKSNGLERI